MNNDILACRLYDLCDNSMNVDDDEILECFSEDELLEKVIDRDRCEFYKEWFEYVDDEDYFF